METRRPTDGQILTRLMERARITQAELADRVGIARSTVCEILKGKRQFSKRHVKVFSAFFKEPETTFTVNFPTE
jgi:transcriptional regulator with XRE-family HTH domain